MSPERAEAYHRVLKTIADVGPSKLLDAEQDRIRYAADNLIFSSRSSDVAAVDALDDVGRLCRALVDSGRWEEVAAQRLSEDVRHCGPQRTTRLRAA